MSAQHEQAFAQVFRPTIWHRLGFGHAHVAPWNDDAHYLVAETHVHFDWLDRLRLLVTGRLHVETRTRTNLEVRALESRCGVKVKGWGWER